MPRENETPITDVIELGDALSETKGAPPGQIVDDLGGYFEDTSITD